MTGLATETLLDILQRVPESLFAVADGAFYEDLPLALKQADFDAKALYRDSSAAGAASAGPQLVALPAAADIARFLDLLGHPPPAVFWSWPSGEDRLYGHLRKLGKVEVPKPDTNPLDPEYDAVVFRHADPRAMAETLEVLGDAQRLDLLGEAAGVVMAVEMLEGEIMILRAPRGGALMRTVA